MDPVHYTYIPVSIALGLEIAFPYLHNLACLDTWITPPLILCKAVFILVNVVFGVLLWQSLKGERDEKLLFSFIWVLFVVNISWIYFYKKNKKLSLFLLFLSLLSDTLFIILFFFQISQTELYFQIQQHHFI